MSSQHKSSNINEYMNVLKLVKNIGTNKMYKK